MRVSIQYIFIALTLPFLILVPPLYAQHSYSEFERGLNLTENQKTKIDGIKRRYMGEWQNLKEDAMRKRLELQELSRDPVANRERINRLQNEIDNIDRSKEDLYNRYREEVSNALTPEQKQKYNTFCDTERGKRGIRSFRQRRYGR
jgi:Spy/CpxP family protein refolding chaperone